MVKQIRAEEIDLQEMTHIACGGWLFENHVHAKGERVFWCMNCDRTLVLAVEETANERNIQGTVGTV